MTPQNPTGQQPRITIEDLDALWQAIQQSSVFSNNNRALQLLGALVVNCRGNPASAVSPSILKKSFSQSFDLPATRTRANQNLDTFFATEGIIFKFAFNITDRKYRLHFFPNPAHKSEQPEASDQFRKFWDPYFKATESPWIVFTSPLFFRDPQYRYIRDIFVNEESKKKKLESVLGKGRSKTWVPSRHYLSAGEVFALLRLLCAFRDRGLKVKYAVVGHMEDFQQGHDVNLISIGSGRTNWHINLHLTSGPFVLRESWIDIKLGNKFIKLHDTDETLYLKRYALLVREPYTHQGLVITMIGANHGRAAEGVADFITREQELKEITSLLTVSDTLPNTFQALFEVDVARAKGESQIKATHLLMLWSIETGTRLTNNGRGLFNSLGVKGAEQYRVTRQPLGDGI